MAEAVPRPTGGLRFLIRHRHQEAKETRPHLAPHLANRPPYLATSLVPRPARTLPWCVMKHMYSGKVRDIYEIDEERLLFVTSDRMSAFDVVMAEPIPSKGRVLVALTAYWTAQLSEVAPTHLISVGVSEDLDLGSVGVNPEFAEGRSMVVRRAEMLPIECIVRGYLSGSAWAEYKRSGTMHGQPLPAGMSPVPAVASAGLHPFDEGD